MPSTRSGRPMAPSSRSLNAVGSGWFRPKGGKRTATTARPRAGTCASDPAWSPDGRWIAATAGDGFTPPKGGLSIIPIVARSDGKHQYRLWPIWASRVRWPQDCKRLFFHPKPQYRLGCSRGGLGRPRPTRTPEIRAVTHKYDLQAERRLALLNGVCGRVRVTRYRWRRDAATWAAGAAGPQRHAREATALVGGGCDERGANSGNADGHRLTWASCFIFRTRIVSPTAGSAADL